MAQIMDGGGGHGKGQKKGRKKGGLPHIDMTPMVDLAFLLLTFFVLTSTFSKPQAMEINMPVPKENKDEKGTEWPENRTITLLVSDNNAVYYYTGTPKGGVAPEMKKTDFSPSGVRKVLLQKNAKAFNMIKKLEQKLIEGTIDKEKFKNDKKTIDKRVALLVVIKADENAKFKNMVDILDEMQITSAGNYAIVDISKDEMEWIKNYKE